ncbi:MAG TPA: hypothetical protein VK666_11610, partial [Chryseolinea sp.]|nr:hypothetical protein [Chryseolinea sp.]
MFRKWPLKKFLVLIAKVTGYVIVSVIAILVLIASIIQIPSVQNRITQEAVAFLQKKIGTKVSLGHFSLSFPKKLVLEEIYLEDKKSDTLLYAGKLSIDTDLWALVHHKIKLNDIALEDSHASISRSGKDGTFNFDYIISAFNTPSAAAPDTTSSPWEFDVGDVQLANIHLIYSDSIAGIDARVQFSKLIVEVEKLDITHDALKIKTTELADARASIVQWQPAAKAQQSNAPTSTSDSTSFDLEIDEINARDVAADYYQKTDGLHARINLGELQIAINELNLPGRV